MATCNDDVMCGGEGSLGWAGECKRTDPSRVGPFLKRSACKLFPAPEKGKQITKKKGKKINRNVSWHLGMGLPGHTVTRYTRRVPAGKVRAGHGPRGHTIGEIRITDNKNPWLLYCLEKQVVYACAGHLRGVRAQDGRESFRTRTMAAFFLVPNMYTSA